MHEQRTVGGSKVIMIFIDDTIITETDMRDYGTLVDTNKGLFRISILESFVNQFKTEFNFFI